MVGLGRVGGGGYFNTKSCVPTGPLAHSAERGADNANMRLETARHPSRKWSGTENGLGP